MQIIGAFDVHRKQITFKWLNTETGEVRRGRIVPALRETVRQFLVPFKGLDAHFALEATTGWRFVAEELSRAGLKAHLAEAAETATLRGTKRRAKTDRRDCDHLVDLLISGRLPESWLPPEHVLEIRTLVRCRKDLSECAAGVAATAPGSTLPSRGTELLSHDDAGTRTPRRSGRLSRRPHRHRDRARRDRLPRPADGVP